MGIFTNKSTFRKFSDMVNDAFMGNINIDDDFFEEMEEALVLGDVSVDTAEKIMEDWKNRINFHRARKPEEMRELLVDTIAKIMDKGERNSLSQETPLIIMMIGVNGGGKTTSIAKIAARCKASGKTVLLAAADTFRAAAADQLEEWGNRIGLRTIRREEGSDPASVIYDAVQSAKASGIDVLICDTAGRLQNKTNLMKELEKMDKIISREYPEAARETLLVLDSTTGKNAISQAEEFAAITDITGIVLTKLDGTARGGISITLADKFDIPIKFIGVGEKIEDLIPFDARQFADSIFEDEAAAEPEASVAPEDSADGFSDEAEESTEVEETKEEEEKTGLFSFFRRK